MKKLLLFLIAFLGCLNSQAQDYSEIMKIVASDRGSEDNFGISVSISGNYAIIGAFREDEDTSGGNSMISAGAAYILKKNSNNNWNQIKKIVASDRETLALFGNSVSISEDYAIVAANHERKDTTGGNYASQAGAAYIFKKDKGGVDNWGEVKKIVASDRASEDWFGHNVSISRNYAIVGAIKEDEDAVGGNTLSNAGAAYIFKKNEGGIDNWGEVKKIVASDRASEDWFGYSISISGNYAFIGTPYEDEDAVGGNTLSNAGSVYIFEKDEGGIDNWGEVQKIVASDRASDDWFGYSISISGNYAIIGAPYEDEDATGGNTISGAGSAYIFKKNQGNNNWSQIKKIVAYNRAYASPHVGTVHHTFGGNVDISENYVIVGSFRNTNINEFVYLFKKDEGGIDNWGHIQELVASDHTNGDAFRKVAISDDYAIVGAYQEDQNTTGGNFLYDAGSAYIFGKYKSTLSMKNTVICKNDTVFLPITYTGIDSLTSILTNINFDTSKLILLELNAIHTNLTTGAFSTITSANTNAEFIINWQDTLAKKFYDNDTLVILSFLAKNVGSVSLIWENDSIYGKILNIEGTPIFTRFDDAIITINALPNGNLGSDQTICIGDSISLTATDGVFYQWSNGQNTDSISVSPIMATTYSVMVTDTNSCIGMDSILVAVNPLPDANVGLDQTTCAGDSISLTATGGVFYQWSNGQNTDSISVNPIITTIYSVMVTDTNSCIGIDSILVAVNPLPDANAGLDQTICIGDSISLMATGGIFYQWSSGQNTDSISVNPIITTTYSVMVTDTNSCTNTDTIIIFVHQPIIPLITQNNDTLISTVANSYQWYLDNSIILGAQNYNLIIAQNGDYYIETIDTNGCLAISSTLNITNVSTIQHSLNYTKVYPNPVQNYLTIESNKGTAVIYNILGQAVKQFNIYNEQTIINVIDLKQGFYILSIEEEDGKIISTNFYKR